MNICKSEIDSTTVFRLEGDLDTNSSPLAEEAFSEAIAGGCSSMLVNLSDVGFVSSAGLRILLATAKRLTGADGSLKITDLNETVHEVFEISGFITILSVYKTEEEALQDA